MKNYGDVTKINGAEVPKVNVITFGAPCQDLSCAGKRAGMKSTLMGDEETTRSGLFFEAIRIIKEMREDDKRNGRADVDIRPRFAVYENVPGAFSSNHGEDFRAVLEETAKVADKDAVIPGPPKGKWTPAGCIMGDGWSIAWRVHDAQFWGVPQRRKRISLVADFAGGGAPEILFEREGLSGDIETSGKEREGAATDVGSGVEETSRCLNGWDVQSKHIQPENGIAESLYAGECRGGGGESYIMQSISFQERAGKPGGGKGILIQNERTGALSTLNNQSVCCLNDQGGSVMSVSEDVTGALRAQEHGHQPIVYGISAYESNAMKSANPNSGIYEAETARTLDLNGGSPACNQGGMAVVSMATKQLSQNIGDNVAMPICANDYKEPQVVCLEGNGSRPSHRGDGYSESETMYTLNSTEHHAVAVENHPADSRVKISEDGMVQTLSGRMGTGVNNVPMVMEQGFAMQAIGEYKQSKAASSLKMRDYKDATDLVVASFYPQMKAESQCYREDDISNTLVNGTNPGFQNGVCYGLDRASYNQGMNAQYDFSVEEEKIATQVAKGRGAVCNNYVVRRLTPMECERLQGFPDHWTDIGDWVDSKGKKHKGESDSPRYKALGNSIALPFWKWMAKRMRKYLGENPTMASLFDGIGGFPLSYSEAGVEPVWASEIEEFPIAVTKLRFPGED